MHYDIKRTRRCPLRLVGASLSEPHAHRRLECSQSIYHRYTCTNLTFVCLSVTSVREGRSREAIRPELKTFLCTIIDIIILFDICHNTQYNNHYSPHLADMYWNTMSNVKQTNSNIIKRRYDDQFRLDSALDLMNPVWEGNRNISLYEWTATTREGFKVTILPEKDVCRKYCTTKSIKQCYVWHNYISQDNKLDNGKNNLGPWYLRDDWEEISARSNAISEEWLREITIL